MEYFPAAHSTQWLRSGEEYVPGTQEVHSEKPFVELVYFPLLHFSHAVDPSFSA
jgi:hypothetical protein